MYDKIYPDWGCFAPYNKRFAVPCPGFLSSALPPLPLPCSLCLSVLTLRSLPLFNPANSVVHRVFSQWRTLAGPTESVPFYLSHSRGYADIWPGHAGILPAHPLHPQRSCSLCFCLLSHPKLHKCPVRTFVTTRESGVGEASCIVPSTYIDIRFSLISNL